MVILHQEKTCVELFCVLKATNDDKPLILPAVLWATNNLRRKSGVYSVSLNNPSQVWWGRSGNQEEWCSREPAWREEYSMTQNAKKMLCIFTKLWPRLIFELLLDNELELQQMII